MATDSIYEKMAKITSSEPSGWLEDARWRMENRAWLRRSQSIALKILMTLREKKMSQKELAEIVGVSPQQVSKIVKGRENLTFETIAMLEKALGIVLMKIPRCKAAMVADIVIPASSVSDTRSENDSGRRQV
ncbi:MAG: helix-turn-helix transcriptional regulator [Chlorobiaceae bacterium]|nr:helix-turn-helix transcriptional regulator [Chlorobiaceae bacterium]